MPDSFVEWVAGFLAQLNETFGWGWDNDTIQQLAEEIEARIEAGEAEEVAAWCDELPGPSEGKVYAAISSAAHYYYTDYEDGTVLQALKETAQDLGELAVSIGEAEKAALEAGASVAETVADTAKAHPLAALAGSIATGLGVTLLYRGLRRVLPFLP